MNGFNTKTGFLGHGNEISRGRDQQNNLDVNMNRDDDWAILFCTIIQVLRYLIKINQYSLLSSQKPSLPIIYMVISRYIEYPNWFLANFSDLVRLYPHCGQILKYLTTSPRFIGTILDPDGLMVEILVSIGQPRAPESFLLDQFCS